MQWLEATPKSLERRRRLAVVKLGRRIGEVNAALWIIVIFSASTHDVGIIDRCRDRYASCRAGVDVAERERK